MAISFRFALFYVYTDLFIFTEPVGSGGGHFCFYTFIRYVGYIFVGDPSAVVADAFVVVFHLFYLYFAGPASRAWCHDFLRLRSFCLGFLLLYPQNPSVE